MSERLELLRPILDQYKRRFTVLDLGAGIEGYQNIGAEIAREYDAVCVMVERDWVREKFIESRRTIVLKHNARLDDLVDLAACEHFDIVLALNFLHWAPANEWRSWADVVIELGEKAFIQLPGEYDYDQVGCLPGASWLDEMRYYIAQQYNPTLVGETVQFPKHAPRPLWLISDKRMSHKLTKTHMDAHENSSRTEIYADNQRVICYHKGQWRGWIPGMNLSNLVGMNMVWPEKERVVELLKSYKLPPTNHGDIVLHNFVFDGEELHLVDGFEGWEFDDKEGLSKVIEQVEMA